MRKTANGWNGNGGQMATRSRKAVARNGVVKAKKLSKEALRLLDEKADEIAKALYESTILGHVLSARLLVDLAEGNVDVEEAMNLNPLRSLALELAQAPQWQDKDAEPAVEMADADPELE
jgi:hypothetical protein